MTLLSSSLYPILSNHIFWNHKTRFQFDVDTYELWILFAVEGGSFSYRIGDAEATAQMGDVVVCPPGLSFHRSVINALTFHYIGFSLGSVPGELTKRTEEEAAIRLQLASSAYKLNIRNLDRLADNMKLLKLHAETVGELRHYWQNHALNDIWHFCRHSEAAPADEENRPADPLIERAKLYIHQHGYGEMSMLKLAAELGISPVQFSRRFCKSMGMTPSDYLSHIRLEKVKTLLIETQFPLEQIALACGFSNGFYLSRVFSKIMKVSPSAYRKMNRV
ncbi:AraC family transcriptional regulator [Paenibacillus alkaliterrae]|uniref:AraC family transcriptional regulator n=1 Tax=Paenibacillus alkaliterrae TaxID=320909 RepID=UPI001F2D01AD|nr:AraC family transcriptional regulator [Paenibacillus alkaliterrae]MCF2937912.1 AraC family transcriptional regulator [Paenibacillus alkaliterrae]